MRTSIWLIFCALMSLHCASMVSTESKKNEPMKLVATSILQAKNFPCVYTPHVVIPLWSISRLQAISSASRAEQLFNKTINASKGLHKCDQAKCARCALSLLTQLQSTIKEQHLIDRIMRDAFKQPFASPVTLKSFGFMRVMGPKINFHYSWVVKVNDASVVAEACKSQSSLTPWVDGWFASPTYSTKQVRKELNISHPQLLDKIHAASVRVYDDMNVRQESTPGQFCEAGKPWAREEMFPNNKINGWFYRLELKVGEYRIPFPCFVLVIFNAPPALKFVGPEGRTENFCKSFLLCPTEDNDINVIPCAETSWSETYQTVTVELQDHLLCPQGKSLYSTVETALVGYIVKDIRRIKDKKYKDALLD